MAACSPAYVPNKVNTGLFTEPGEMHGELATGVSGTDIQVAAAIPGNLVVTANASFKNRDLNTTVWADDDGSELVNVETNRKHRIFEVGAGYYQTWEDGLTLEAIAGYGRGTLENVETDLIGPILFGSQNSPTTFITESTFNKIYIQPTIGLSKRFVDLGFTPKIAFVRININDQQFSDTYFEPTVTLRAGPEKVKFTGQLGLSIPSGETIQYSYEPFIFSVGIMADINVLKLGKSGEN